METAIINNVKYALVSLEEYKQLLKRASARLHKDTKGNLPALAAMDATIARNIVRDRRAVGLSQKELADAAGIRVEVLNRAERGVTVPSMQALTKIEKALRETGLKG